jgi:protein-disulfide isomerase
VKRFLKICLFWAVLLPVAPASAETLNVDKQMQDIVLGDAKAPNTIIEYFSLTCGHCRDFHANVLPKLKKNLIDTGKAKFIARDFPLNAHAAYAHMLARCAPANRYHAYVDVLFKNFDRWTQPNDPRPALKNFAKLGGMGSAEFDACMTNDPLYQKMRKMQEEAVKKFDVDSTPTIIVNGTKVDGTYEAIEKALKKE